jgi:predicted lipoprotein
MGYDISKILAEYGDDDFGFSAVSEEEYNAVITEKADTVEEYAARLREIEKLVLPFFTKLLKTADKEYIYWPNRKELVEKQIQKILTLTRG